MTFYERASGSDCMLTILDRWRSSRYPIKTIEDIEKFCKSFPKIIDDLEGLLTENRIFKQRNVEIVWLQNKKH